MTAKPRLSLSLRLLACLSMAYGLSAMPVVAAEKATNAISKPASNQIILQPGASQLASLKIEQVVEIPAPATEPLNGKVTFDENHTARIYSPVLGRVQAIKVQVGDSVTAGQPLLQVDSPDLGSAIADARRAEVDLQFKQKTLDRNQMLLEGGVIAQKDVELARADMLSARAEAERAHARLKTLGVSRSEQQAYVVRSPINGVVVERKVNPGSELRPDASDPLFIVTDPTYLWASIDLPERDLGKVSNGQAVSLQVDAYPDLVFSGKVQSIGVMVDPVTRRVPVRCVVNSQGKLKPEMYARITPLDNRQHNVIRLPNSALITEGLYSYVFVEETPLHLKKRRVVLGMQQKSFATVKEGLKPGERVVTVGAILLNSELASDK